MPKKADAEPDAGVGRLEQHLRTLSHEWFDGRRQLRMRALVSRLAKRFGSTTNEGDMILHAISAVRRG